MPTQSFDTCYQFLTLYQVVVLAGSHVRVPSLGPPGRGCRDASSRANPLGLIAKYYKMFDLHFYIWVLRTCGVVVSLK